MKDGHDVDGYDPDDDVDGDDPDDEDGEELDEDGLELPLEDFSDEEEELEDDSDEERLGRLCECDDCEPECDFCFATDDENP